MISRVQMRYKGNLVCTTQTFLTSLQKVGHMIPAEAQKNRVWEILERKYTPLENLRSERIKHKKLVLLTKKSSLISSDKTDNPMMVE